MNGSSSTGGVRDVSSEAPLQASRISPRFFSICASDCLYPSPYLSGDIFLAGSSPLKSLQVFVNGTEVGGLRNGTPLTNQILQYNTTLQSLPVMVGDLCVLRFVAYFEDSSTETQTIVVVVF
jgi:hypothetical protein